MKLRIYLLTVVTLFMTTNINAEKLQKSVKSSGFTWGVDAGSSIDMSNNGMSSIDGDAYFGFKNSFLRTIGLGAAIHSSLGNGNSFIPVYAILRTSFTSRPVLCFLDLRGGYSFNSINNDDNQKGAFGSVGVGFNLYSNTKFKSHIILAYNYFKLSDYTKDQVNIKTTDLHAMSVRIGISF